MRRVSSTCFSVLPHERFAVIHLTGRPLMDFDVTSLVHVFLYHVN